MSYQLDPDATLDFAEDWTDWLAAAETITAHTVTADPADAVTIAAHDEDAGVVTAWLTDGTVGQVVSLTFHIVTDQGRADDRTMVIRVAER